MSSHMSEKERRAARIRMKAWRKDPDNKKRENEKQRQRRAKKKALQKIMGEI